MSDKKPINEQELNELLRALYLQASGGRHAKDAQLVFDSDYDVAVDAGKEAALIKKLQRRGGGFNGLHYMVLFVVLAALIAVLWNVFPARLAIEAKAKEQPATGQPAAVALPVHKDPGLVRATKPMPAAAPDTFGRPPAMAGFLGADSAAAARHQPEPARQAPPAEPSIPVLTATDRVKYMRLKEQIIALLVKRDKGLYTHVPANKINYAGKETVLAPFNLRNVGITNLEYKTFLADLLIQERDADYLTAQVNYHNWAAQGYNRLGASYFTDDAYNDFPVVNISAAAARLFCKWLEAETAAYITTHKLKARQLLVRLPSAEEWIGAAREGYAKIAFEKGYNTIYDLSEGLVDRSFVSRAELVRKRVKRVDSLYSFFTVNRYGWTEQDMLDFFNKGLRYYKTSLVTDTIDVERMKVLGKTGRVSEIVFQSNSGRLWLPGLSWESKESYLQLEKEFNVSGTSPFVGFRVVVVNPGDPEYKDPFW